MKKKNLKNSNDTTEQAPRTQKKKKELITSLDKHTQWKKQALEVLVLVIQLLLLMPTKMHKLMYVHQQQQWYFSFSVLKLNIAPTTPFLKNSGRREATPPLRLGWVVVQVAGGGGMAWSRKENSGRWRWWWGEGLGVERKKGGMENLNLK